MAFYCSVPGSPLPHMVRSLAECSWTCRANGLGSRGQLGCCNWSRRGPVSSPPQRWKWLPLLAELGERADREREARTLLPQEACVPGTGCAQGKPTLGEKGNETPNSLLGCVVRQGREAVSLRRSQGWGIHGPSFLRAGTTSLRLTLSIRADSCGFHVWGFPYIPENDGEAPCLVGPPGKDGPKEREGKENVREISAGR